MKTRIDLRKGVLLAMGALSAVLVSGCGGAPGDSPKPASSTTGLSVTASQPAAPPGASPPSTPVSVVAPPASAPVLAPPPAADPVPECRVTDLRVELGQGEGAAGTVYRPLLFINSGGRTCFVHGFPGVSYVAGDDGRQVGPAAVRDAEKGGPVTLAPGQAGFATVGFVNVQNYDEAACQPTPVKGLRVYPPHETESVFVPMDNALGCAGNPPGQQLSVMAVRLGTGG